MTVDEMVEKVKGWIVDRSRTTEQSIDVAENIRDLCEEWIDALKEDLESKRRAAIEAGP